jgi:ABC-2 type transport system ATP-binding protein
MPAMRPLTEPEPKAALEVERITLRARARRLVDEVSFSARAGEVTAVIGPNGAGKTSLLEATLGLRQAESGQVRHRGTLLSTFRQRARVFAYLPDQSELPSEVSVRTLVEQTARSQTSEAPLEQLRALLAIEPLLALGCGVLSRGERQRVQLFCALASGRPVLVLDEPFSAFDPLQLRGVHQALELITGQGAAIVASIHQLAEAERIADRVLLLADGRALAFGAPSELKRAAGKPDASLEDAFIELLEARSRAA